MSSYGDLIRELRSQRPVLLLGSVVSYLHPTCLPTGGAVSAMLLDLLFKDPDEAGESWPRWLREDAETLPFEVVIGSHPKVDDPSTEHAIASLFGARESNAVHREVAAAVEAGILSAVVTTNYDLALDAGFSAGSILVTDEDCTEWLQRGRGRPRPLLKVHGSAELPDSLVYALVGKHGEKPLLPGAPKFDALSTILSHRPLIVAGYSGRDLDVCPAIAQIDGLTRVVWIDPFPREELTPNAYQVLEAHDGLHIRCDLRHFLSVLLRSEEIDESRFCDEATPDLSHFSPIEDRRRWRLRALDRLGCASSELPTRYRTQALTTVEEQDFRLARFGHAGRYRDLARSLRGARLGQRTGTEPWVACRIAESTAWLLMGFGRRAHRGLRRAQHAFTTLEPKDAALEAKLNRLTLTCAMRSHQWASRFKRHRRAQRIVDEAQTAFEAADRYYKQEGEWDVVRTLEHEALRLGISERSALALPVTPGYESVGLRTMAAISSRDRIRSRPSGAPWLLSHDLQVLAEELVIDSERYGHHHEAWKLYWILLLRGRGRGRRTWFLRWLEHFLKVQYKALYRLAQPIAQIVRSGGPQEVALPDPPTLKCGRSSCLRVSSRA